MTRYRLELTKRALKDLKQIDRSDHGRLQGAITLLAQDPQPPGAVKLKGRDGYRVQVGPYRVIYTIDHGVVLIVVLRIGHRRDIYD